jgi:Domain of unknown function (DUF5668)
MFVGLLLILMGALMIADRMGYLPGSVWSYFWPAAIILIGLSMLFRKSRKSTT